jgi:transmembrane sensor
MDALTERRAGQATSLAALVCGNATLPVLIWAPASAGAAASQSERTEDGALVVTCIAGEAICSTGSSSLTAAANEQIAIRSDGGSHKSPVDAALVTAWRQDLLIFNNTPLRQVVAEINRYRPGRIILTDPKVASMPINGVFHAAHIENTVAQIRKLLGVHTTRLPGGVVLMG